VREEP